MNTSSGTGPSENCRILVVDDDQDFAESLRELLESRDFIVDTGYDTKQALKKEQSVRPEVALIDLRLGHGNGIDLVTTLKRRRPGLVCIMITANADPESAVEALRVGADDYLRKPFQPAELFATIETSVRKLHLTQQKRAAESALRESEERFRDITAHVPGVVYQFKIDADGKASFPFVSPTIKDVLGLEADDIVENADLFFDVVHPDDRAAMDASILETHETLAPWLWEGRMIRPSGAAGWFRGSSTPRKLDDGAVLWNGLLLDVTDRNRAEAARKESEQQLRLVTDNLPVVIIYLDRASRFTFANKTAETWFGRPMAEIVGKQVKDILGGASYERLRPHIAKVLAGEKVTFEEEIAYPDGQTRDVIASYIPHFGTDGQVQGLFGLVQDVSDHKGIEQQLRQAQKMEAVGQLTGGVAHDFNNLLAVILGNAELLDGKLDGEDGDLLEAIIRAGERGAELTRRLLAFSRKQALRPTTLDLGELFGGLYSLLSRSLGETIEIETKAAPGLWPATADPGQVENALLNLAINARDAMPDGGKLTIECANAELDRDYVAQNPEADAGDYVALSVSDTGVGMSEEAIERAFEPFFTTKQVGEGTGLGLSMVYGFAKQSGGHVRLYSEAGKGTTVRLYLPRAELEADRAEIKDADQVPRGRGEVVLVVEDDPDVRRLVVRILGSLGYRVVDAPDARAALAVLSAGETVDLLLSDVVLAGGMSGPELARLSRERHRDLKILLMTGYAAEAANRNGGLGLETVLLNKPFQRHELADKLRAVLDG